MRVLLLSIDADFGPGARPGRAARVGRLSAALARAGAEVVVVAGDVRGDPSPAVTLIAGADHPPLIGRDDVLAWALHLSNGMLEAATGPMREAPADVVHAHDWQTAWAAAALKGSFGIPLVSTLHSLRQADGRDPGGAIARQAAWWLTYESRRTILPDRHVRSEIERVFQLPAGKQDVIGPGRGTWAAVAERTLACYRRAIAEEESSLWRGDRKDVARLRSLWRTDAMT